MAPLAVPLRLARCAPGRAAWKPLLGRYLLSLPRVVWMGLDLLLVVVGTLLGQRMFVNWTDGAALLGDANPVVASAVLGASVCVSGLMFGLYERSTLWRRSRIAARSLATIVVAMLTTWLVLDILIYSNLSRRAAVTAIAFFLVTAPLIRWLAHGAVVHVQRGLLVVGHGPTVGAIVRSVRRGAVPGYRLAGVVLDRSRPADREIPVAAVVGEPDDIEQICRRCDVREVVVAHTPGGDAADPATHRVALACLRLGCRVTDELTFYEKTFGEVPLTHLSPAWFLFADLKGQRQEHATAKRLFDLVASVVGLLLTLPLWPLLVLAVRLQGRGPILYSQVRVGQGGRPFRLYKFRTMCPDAEPNGSVWAAPDDPRVTRIGRLLRRTRLDELPQIWNVVRGQMSFIGPRPERPEFVAPLARLIPYYNERHLIKPGLTGWAQINFKYGASIADARRKLQLDLYYIKHMSLELDLVILLRTIGMVLSGSC